MKLSLQRQVRLIGECARGAWEQGGAEEKEEEDDGTATAWIGMSGD